MQPAAGKKMEFPLGPVSRIPFTPLTVANTRLQLFINSLICS